MNPNTAKLFGANRRKAKMRRLAVLAKRIQYQSELDARLLKIADEAERRLLFAAIRPLLSFDAAYPSESPVAG